MKWSVRRTELLFIAFSLSVWSGMCFAQGPVPNPQAADFELSFPKSNDKDYLEMPAPYQARLNEALGKLKTIWSGEAFKQKVIGYKYVRYGNNQDATGQLVYDTVTKSHPKKLTWYLCNFNADALASTYPPGDTSCIFKSYMDDPRTAVNNLIDTLSHEFTHIHPGGLYEHWFHRHAGREQTVPYAVGYMAEDLADALYPDTKMLLPRVKRRPFRKIIRTRNDR